MHLYFVFRGQRLQLFGICSGGGVQYEGKIKQLVLFQSFYLLFTVQKALSRYFKLTFKKHASYGKEL